MEWVHHQVWFADNWMCPLLWHWGHLVPETTPHVQDGYTSSVLIIVHLLPIRPQELACLFFQKESRQSWTQKGRECQSGWPKYVQGWHPIKTLLYLVPRHLTSLHHCSKKLLTILSHNSETLVSQVEPSPREREHFSTVKVALPGESLTQQERLLCGEFI